MKLTVWDDLG